MEGNSHACAQLNFSCPTVSIDEIQAMLSIQSALGNFVCIISRCASIHGIFSFFISSLVHLLRWSKMLMLTTEHALMQCDHGFDSCCHRATVDPPELAFPRLSLALLPACLAAVGRRPSQSAVLQQIPLSRLLLPTWLRVPSAVWMC